MRWLAAIAGVAAFTLAHVLTTQEWSAYGGQYEPWFLNSGRSVLLTAVACAIAAGVVTGVNDTPRFVESGFLTGGGAFVASLVILFWRVGAGTIFPIVIVVDAMVLLASSMVGAGLVSLAKRA